VIISLDTETTGVDMDTDILTLTVAVRSSDGAVFHCDKTKTSKLSQLCRGSTEPKWGHLIRQMIEHRRPVRVLLLTHINPYTGGDRTYEELIYRPRGDK
jgi:hypothetical protein